jgi:hypothetical protein
VYNTIPYHTPTTSPRERYFFFFKLYGMGAATGTSERCGKVTKDIILVVVRVFKVYG